MKKFIYTLTSFILAFTCNAKADQLKLKNDAYPEFSWDTVPVALHFSSRYDFSEAQVEFLAKFPVFCVEKHQGVSVHNDARKGAFVLTKAIKELNPKAKVLFYWNSNIDGGKNYFGHQILAKGHHPEWKLRGTEDVLVRGYQETFDTTVPEFRKWWVSIPVEAVKEGNMDGVFIDAIPHFFREEAKHVKILGEEKYKAVQQGVATMAQDLALQLGDDKILLFNNMNEGGRDFEKDLAGIADGGMIENFCNFSLNITTKESSLAQIDQLGIAAKQKRIMMVKGWPRYSYRRSEQREGIPEETIDAHVKEDIIFPLSCFLMGAGEYAYFVYSWGYRSAQGSLLDYPEYSKPLGKPLGDYTRNGWILTRKFEYADVWVDLENVKAKIDWKK
ncbi:MAG: putative glycoside hydrolase [Opitutales bacterium]